MEQVAASSDHSLKSQNRFALWGIVIFDAAIVYMMLIYSGHISLPHIMADKLTFESLASFSSLASIVPLMFINDLFSSDFKDSIVFMRLTHQLPGHRAFSEHMHSDSRVDPKKLKQKYVRLPDDPVEQSRLWYRIYLKHSVNIRVADSHRLFLLLREAAALSLLMLAAATLIAFALDLSRYHAAYLLGILCIQLIFFCVSAKNRGIRLVKTVLALESAS